MDAETMYRAFGPFFTTKPPGQGTGLGLSAVYGIITKACGGITVDSEEGPGTTFRIYLSATGEPTPAARVVQANPLAEIPLRSRDWGRRFSAKARGPSRASSLANTAMLALDSVAGWRSLSYRRPSTTWRNCRATPTASSTSGACAIRTVKPRPGHLRSMPPGARAARA